MILVRNVFRLKFGKAKEALALWKEGIEILKKAGPGPYRVLTDLTGPAYTLVLEGSYPSLAAFEQGIKDTLTAREWGEWYAKFVPLAESSCREIFTIVE